MRLIYRHVLNLQFCQEFSIFEEKKKPLVGRHLP
jgi:hypothetical protein